MRKKTIGGTTREGMTSIIDSLEEEVKSIRKTLRSNVKYTLNNLKKNSRSYFDEQQNNFKII